MIWPWLEVNNCTESEIKRAIDGAGDAGWTRVALTQVITTAPGHADLYTRLGEALPRLRIYGGLKTATLLPRFDDLDGWSRIVDELIAIREQAGLGFLLLENESAIKRLLAGSQRLNLPRFRRCLEKLQAVRGVDLLWYPSVAGSSTTTSSWRTSRSVVQAVQEVLADHVVFVDRSLYSPALTWSAVAAGNRAFLERIATRPPIPQIYCGTASNKSWPDEWIVELPGLLRAEPLLIYPDAARWVETSRTLVDALLARWKQPNRPAAQKQTRRVSSRAAKG